MDLDPDLDWRVLATDGFNAHIGAVALAEITPFEWRFRLEVAEQHINLGGVCHGGVSMTLADIGMGYAAASALGRIGCTTIAFDAQFIAAAKLGQELHGVAKVTRATRDLAFVECALYAGGRQTMSARGVWKALSSREPMSTLPDGPGQD